MSLPEALMTIAAVGTDKGSTLREIDPALDGLLSKRADLALEGRILLTAAGLRLQQQAGWLPTQDKRPLPEPCEPDTLPTVKEQALHHLALMVEGDFRTVMPEWLREMAARKLRLPEEALPIILDEGRKHKELRELIMPVLGNRGVWLGKQATSRHWAWFDLDDADKVWQKGNTAERADLLETIRATDPVRARTMLQAVWNEEKADERTRFLSTFEFGLSMADEPFLDAALDDRAQDVRGAAIWLLSLLPESRFVARMVERGLPLVELDTSKEGEKILSVHVISKGDDALRRDGVELADGKQRGTTKQQWTHFILKRIAPSLWCQKFGLTKAELVKIAFNEHSDEQMINSLAWGAYHAQDAAFTEMLLAALTSPQHENTVNMIDADLQARLMNLIAEPERVLLSLLKQRQGVNLDTLFPFLKLYTEPWSKELALAVCAKIGATVQNLQSFYILHAGLRDIALYFPVSISDELINQLTVEIKEAARYGPAWRTVIDTVQTLLDFRREMLSALHA